MQNLHVATGTDLNEDIHVVMLRDGINGGLNRAEVAEAVEVDEDSAVAGGPHPVVAAEPPARIVTGTRRRRSNAAARRGREWRRCMEWRE